MTGLHKFSLKKSMLAFIAFAFFCAITWKSAARHINSPEIYSTLTTDTIPRTQKDSILRADSIATDTLPTANKDSVVTDTLYNNIYLLKH